VPPRFAYVLLGCFFCVHRNQRFFLPRLPVIQVFSFFLLYFPNYFDFPIFDRTIYRFFSLISSCSVPPSTYSFVTLFSRVEVLINHSNSSPIGFFVLFSSGLPHLSVVRFPFPPLSPLFPPDLVLHSNRSFCDPLPPCSSGQRIFLSETEDKTLLSPSLGFSTFFFSGAAIGGES